MSVYGFYLMIALGAAGVYLALPRWGARSGWTAGSILLIAALAGSLFLLARFVVGQGALGFYFVVFAGLALMATVRLITHPKPAYSALYFLLVILAVAGLLILQEAEFLAIALVIIYAGAILVTYLFVIMMAQQSRAAECDTRSRMPLEAVAAGFVLIAVITGQIAELPSLHRPKGVVEHELVAYAAQPEDAEAPASASAKAEALVPGNTEQIGAKLLTRYMGPMQVGGVLLLVAMVGAIGMARKRIPDDELPRDVRTQRPVGEIGKMVDPF